MQAETVKRSGFPHERVRKQEVQTKKTLSCWWKRAPHQPITKLHGKPRDLVAGGGLEGTGWKGESSSASHRGSIRDREFQELGDL